MRESAGKGKIRAKETRFLDRINRMDRIVAGRPEVGQAINQSPLARGKKELCQGGPSPAWRLAFSLIVLPDRGKTQKQTFAFFASLRFR
jgi:hypothetical protein